MKRTIAMLGTVSVLVLAAASAAQAGTIAGRVTDGTETIGLEGATIRVVETGQTVAAGPDGSFRIAGLPAGEYTLRVSYVGAEPQDIPVALASADATVSPVIALGSDVDYVDNILVIGQRGALNSALSRQRSDDGLITVLSADAIGQFPDENVAEAARRAVGVNVLNDQGEGRFVSIRGASPNLVSTSVNGVRLTSPEAEDRQVGLDVIDADILSSIVINKSLLPYMDADSVGGNVEIETLSGLDVDAMMLRGRAAVLFSDLQQEFGSRASVNYADNFMDGRLGVAASLSYQERVFGSENIEVDGEWETGEATPFPNEMELRDYQVTRERTTAALNFDYQASPDLRLFLRTTYSDFSDQEYRSRVEVKFEDGDFEDGLSDADTAVFSSDGFGVDRDIKDRLEVQSIYAAELGGEWFHGNTTVDASLSYVYGEESEPDRLDTSFETEFESGELFAVDVSDPMRPALAFPVNDDRNAFYDPSNYELDAFEFTNGISLDREWAAQVNVRHDFAGAAYPGYIQYGLRGRNRDKKYNLDLTIYGDDNEPTLADFPNTVDYGLEDIGVVPDARAIRRYFFDGRADLDLEDVDTAIESLVADYRAVEDVYAGYLMGSVDIGALRLVGGVRVEQTDFEATGYQVFLAEEDATVGGIVLGDDTVFIEETQAADDYTDVLPSVNARYEIRENLIARAAYYGSIQRPNPGQVAPRVFIEQNDDNDVEAEFGNPDLQRLEAQNFDASLEWYPNNDAVVSIGYFYKDLENFIGEIQYEDITVNGIAVDEALSFTNLPTAELSGFEFNYQQALDFLPVEGFIAGFNYTWSDSDAQTAEGRTIPLPQQSDEVWNAILGYDNGPWDLRAVYTNRSEFLAEIRGEGSDRIALEHSQLDLSAKFNFNDHLQIFGDIKNVTDEPFRAVTRPDGVDRLEQYEEYGWSTVFGLRVTY